MQAIASDMVLTLEERGTHAVLTSRFESGWRLRGDSPLIHLEVYVPASVTLDVTDSSGSITISGVHGDISVEDSSGSIRMRDVDGDLIVKDDGSGALRYSNIAGRVENGRR